MKNFKLALILCLLFQVPAFAVTVRAAMHVHSTVSANGQETFDGILSKAKARGIDAVFFSDHDFIDIEYGLPPFKDTLKAKISKASIFTYGPEKYAEEIAAAEGRVKGVLAFPGAESSAYYHWKREGSNFTLEDWNKHMVVLGADGKVLAGLPVLPNKASWHFDPLKLWPLFLLFPAFVLVRGLVFRRAGLILYIICAAMLLLNFPFKSPDFSQYGKRESFRPYEKLVNYVHSKGGLIFWAHPEVNGRPELPGFSMFGVNVSLSAPAYYNEILVRDNADGFAYFWEGEKEVGRIGGIWDRTLMDYCEGRRDKPVWAFGELDYDREGDAGVFIDSVQNVITAKEKTAPSIMEALREGHFYVLKRGNTKALLNIDEFSLTDSKIILKASFSDGAARKVKLEIISGGKVVRAGGDVTPCFFRIERGPSKVKEYFRAEMTCAEDGSKAVTNPLFSEVEK